jgi:hypothetical protein
LAARHAEARRPCQAAAVGAQRQHRMVVLPMRRLISSAPGPSACDQLRRARKSTDGRRPSPRPGLRDAQATACNYWR